MVRCGELFVLLSLCNRRESVSTFSRTIIAVPDIKFWLNRYIYKKELNNLFTNVQLSNNK